MTLYRDEQSAAWSNQALSIVIKHQTGAVFRKNDLDVYSCQPTSQGATNIHHLSLPRDKLKGRGDGTKHVSFVVSKLISVGTLVGEPGQGQRKTTMGQKTK